MFGHVNTTHREEGTFKPNRIGIGKLVATENDIILNMEHDYGRIRTEIAFGESLDDFARKLICNKCGHSETEKDSIKKHIAKAPCRQMVGITDLRFPYCEGSFAHLGSLNRHIYVKRSCKKINLTNKTWIDVWNDMCRKNS